jgi:hypothetical protein
MRRILLGTAVSVVPLPATSLAAIGAAGTAGASTPLSARGRRSFGSGLRHRLRGLDPCEAQRVLDVTMFANREFRMSNRTIETIEGHQDRSFS